MIQQRHQAYLKTGSPVFHAEKAPSVRFRQCQEMHPWYRVIARDTCPCRECLSFNRDLSIEDSRVGLFHIIDKYTFTSCSRQKTSLKASISVLKIRTIRKHSSLLESNRYNFHQKISFLAQIFNLFLCNTQIIAIDCSDPTRVTPHVLVLSSENGYTPSMI